MPVVVHDRLEEITADAWNGLVARSPVHSVFQSYEWHRACVRAYGVGEGLRLVSVMEGDRYLAIAPFYRERRGRINVLKFIGDVRSDYCDIIYDGGAEHALREVIRYLKDHPDVADEIELNNVPEMSPTCKALKQLPKDHRFCFFQRGETPCPTLIVRGQEDFVARTLAKKSLRRHANFFMSREGFEVRHMTDPREIGLFLRAFFTQHLQRWSERDDQSLFIHRENRDFYRHLVNELPVGRVLFTAIFSSGAPVAFHLGFLDGEKLIWYKPSFDIALAKHSPGEVLLKELIAYARDHKLLELDFTRGDEPFKSRFANKVRYNVSLVLRRRWRRYFRLRMKEIVRRSSLLHRPASFAFELLHRAVSFASEVKQTFEVILNRRRIVDNLRHFCLSIRSQEEYYDSQEIVREYRKEAGLQKPEAEILRRLRPELPTLRMLDVGMGAGRTSVYFANIVREYVAFDFAPGMVRASRELLGDLVDPTCFLQGDARRMSFLDDESFDFVLISFNAVDCVPERDRDLVFQEVRRVARQGAWFCFSAHNIQSLRWRGGQGAGDFLRKLRRYLLLLEANKDLGRLACRDHAMVRDISGQYELPVYYIRPEEQVRRLVAMGFHDVRVFASDGKEVVSPEELAGLTESWVYYLCRV